MAKFASSKQENRMQYTQYDSRTFENSGLTNNLEAEKQQFEGFDPLAKNRLAQAKQPEPEVQTVFDQ
jgi:hypothetical protein